MLSKNMKSGTGPSHFLINWLMESSDPAESRTAEPKLFLGNFLKSSSIPSLFGITRTFLNNKGVIPTEFTLEMFRGPNYFQTFRHHPRARHVVDNRDHIPISNVLDHVSMLLFTGQVFLKKVEQFIIYQTQLLVQPTVPDALCLQSTA